MINIGCGNLDEELWTAAREGIKKICISHNGNLCCVMEEIQNGNFVSAHNHPNEQVSVVIQGTCNYYVGEEVFEMSLGSWVVIPPNTKHYIHTFDSAEPVLVLDIYVYKKVLT